MKIVGCDPSLTCTGVVGLTLGVAYPLVVRSLRTPSDGAAAASLRVRWNRIGVINHRFGEILDKLDDLPGPLVVVMEAHDFQTSRETGGHAHDRGGLWWQLAGTAFAYGAQVVQIHPPQLKIYATGNGRADKPEVQAAAEATYGISFANDNEADAYILAAIGCEVAGRPLADVGPERRRALDAVHWTVR